MRRALALALGLMLLAALAACGKEQEETTVGALPDYTETTADPEAGTAAETGTAAPAQSAGQTTAGTGAAETVGQGESFSPATEETDPAEEETVSEETFTISAAGLELKYPARWQDRVTVTAEEDLLSFACGDVKLFDLSFNKEGGVVLGTVTGEEYIVIRVVDYEFTAEDQDLYAMLEDVNVILQHLMEDYDFAVGEELAREDSDTFDIKTPVVTMKYPARWQDKVQVTVSAESVKFACLDTPLFDLVFQECDGFLLGTYDGTPIYIVDYEVQTDEQAAMQEDVNVILQELMKDEKFKVNM